MTNYFSSRGLVRSLLPRIPLLGTLLGVGLYLALPAMSAPQEGGGGLPTGERVAEELKAEGRHEADVFWASEEGREWEHCRETSVGTTAGTWKDGSTCPFCKSGEGNNESAEAAWEENRENHGGFYPGAGKGPAILEALSELLKDGHQNP